MTPPVSGPKYEQDRDAHDPNVESAPLPAADDPLAVLALEINACHRQCLHSLRTTLDHAIATGKKLVMAKNLVKGRGGKWEIWVANNCEFDIRQAQKYVRLAKNEKRIRENAPFGTLSGINAAMDFIANHMEKNADSENGQPDTNAQTTDDPAIGHDVAAAIASDGSGDHCDDYGGDAPAYHGDGAVDGADVLISDDDGADALAADHYDGDVANPDAIWDGEEPVESDNTWREARAEILIALAEMDNALISQCVTFFETMDWQRFPAESHGFLCEALDRLIRVARKARKTIDKN